MLSTTQLRTAWGPACAGPFTTMALHGEGRVHVRSAVVDAVRALDACLVAHGYRTRRGDTGAYNCRRITGGTGYSLHAYGIAIDINWQANPYGPRLVTDMPPAMVAAIKAIRTRNGKPVWRWGGDYRTNKDAMHFEVVCTPGDLATGIDAATIPGHTPAPAPVRRRALRQGHTGPDVRWMQALLDQVAVGNVRIPRVTVDGDFGPKTKAAVLAFEGEHNIFLAAFQPRTPRLARDGVATIPTQDAISWWAAQARNRA